MICRPWFTTRDPTLETNMDMGRTIRLATRGSFRMIKSLTQTSLLEETLMRNTRSGARNRMSTIENACLRSHLSILKDDCAERSCLGACHRVWSPCVTERWVDMVPDNLWSSVGNGNCRRNCDSDFKAQRKKITDVHYDSTTAILSIACVHKLDGRVATPITLSVRAHSGQNIAFFWHYLRRMTQMCVLRTKNLKNLSAECSDDGDWFFT